MDRLNLLQEMLAEDPKDSFVLFAIAKEYEKKDKATAIDAYLRLKELDPSYVGLYYHLGKIYEADGNTGQAIATYSEGIEVAKKQADFHSISELNTAKTNLEME